MTETPGLGDKIIKDPAFLANFDALQARVSPEGRGLEQAIVTVKHGTKTDPWQIDAISGATVTSNAVGKALNKSAQALAPLVQQHLNAFEETRP
jgi:electron transport complex protein RnfG